MTDLKWGDVSKKIGNVKSETRAIAKEVFEAAKAAGHEIWYVWGMGTSAEHKTGLALDLMVHNEAAGDWVRNYIWANRKRLRLRHVIWEQHITSTVNSPGVRRKMEDRGNATANHYDHNHVWLFEGEYQAPDSGDKTPAPPKTDELLTTDGKLGPKTIAKWQKVMGTTVDGKIDDKNSELIKAVQRKLRVVDPKLAVDGDMGPRTIRALQRYLKSPVDGFITKPSSLVIKALQRRLNEGRF
jgi:hypothetical protein